jgi:hypothetical protein
MLSLILAASIGQSMSIQGWIEGDRPDILCFEVVYGQHIDWDNSGFTGPWARMTPTSQAAPPPDYENNPEHDEMKFQARFNSDMSVLLVDYSLGGVAYAANFANPQGAAVEYSLPNDYWEWDYETEQWVNHMVWETYRVAGPITGGFILCNDPENCVFSDRLFHTVHWATPQDAAFLPSEEGRPMPAVMRFNVYLYPQYGPIVYDNDPYDFDFGTFYTSPFEALPWID